VIAAGGKGGGRWDFVFVFVFVSAFVLVWEDTPHAAKQHCTSPFLLGFGLFAFGSLGVWEFGGGSPESENRSMGCVRFDNA